MTPRAPIVTVASFHDDPLFPRIERVVAAILATGKVVAPVDVLVRMDLLAPDKLEAWRRGRVPYLERVINCNLTRLARLLRILRFHVHDLNLAPSVTAYMRWGKGPKQRLRFTKTGAPKLEEAYTRHFVWPGKGPFHPPASSQRSGELVSAAYQLPVPPSPPLVRGPTRSSAKLRELEPLRDTSRYFAKRRGSSRREVPQ